MAKIIQFPVPKLPEEGRWIEPPEELDPEPIKTDTFVSRILQRRHERSRDESLLDDGEFQEVLARLERLDAEQDELLERLDRDSGKGFGVLFWICLLIFVL